MVTLGLVGLGSGGVAVFVTHLEAGPVALLAVGLVLLLVAAGGRLPSRLKVGDSEATWDAVEEFVERVAEGVSPDQRPELVDALNDLRRAARLLLLLASVQSQAGLLTNVSSWTCCCRPSWRSIRQTSCLNAR